MYSLYCCSLSSPAQLLIVRTDRGMDLAMLHIRQTFSVLDAFHLSEVMMAKVGVDIALLAGSWLLAEAWLFLTACCTQRNEKRGSEKIQ